MILDYKQSLSIEVDFLPWVPEAFYARFPVSVKF